MPKAQTMYSNKYNAKAYNQIKINAKKSDRLPELIEIASGKTNVSKQSYMIQAIKDKLAKDGITLDMLPPME